MTATLRALPQFLLEARITLQAQSKVESGTRKEMESVREEMIALHTGLQHFLEAVGYDLTNPVLHSPANPSLTCSRRIITSQDGPRGVKGEVDSTLEVEGSPAELHLCNEDIDLLLRLLLQAEPLSLQQEQAARKLRVMFDEMRMRSDREKAE